MNFEDIYLSKVTSKIVNRYEFTRHDLTQLYFVADMFGFDLNISVVDYNRIVSSNDSAAIQSLSDGCKLNLFKFIKLKEVSL